MRLSRAALRAAIPLLMLATILVGAPSAASAASAGDLELATGCGYNENPRHTMRASSNGSWSAYGAPTREYGSDMSKSVVGIATVGADSQTVAVKDGELYHAVRRANGQWTQFLEVEPYSGDMPYLYDVAATAVNNDLWVVASSLQGVHITIRSGATGL